MCRVALRLQEPHTDGQESKENGAYAMSTLAARMIGSATLATSSYEEVEADSTSTLQAVGVVLVSSVAAAIGTGLKDVESIIGLTVAAIVSWIVWVLLTLFIGTRLLPTAETQADFGQVLRTTGF